MPFTQSASKRKINDSVDGMGDYFDLHSCPDEIIDLAFSFLDVRDRMRMRLNKRLDNIVAESKYYLEKVELEQERNNENKCVTIKNRQYPLDLINRIAHNATIGHLMIMFPHSDELTNKFLSLIKEFRNIKNLLLNFWEMERQKVNEIMIDSFFLDLTRKCETLYLACSTDMQFNNVSAEAIHQVYKSMNDGSTNFHKLTAYDFKSDTIESFLNLLGITYGNEQIISGRNIEAYKETYSFHPGGFVVNIFDGFFHIKFHKSEMSRPYTQLSIELHKNLEEINRKKNNPVNHRLITTVRMDVYPVPE